MQVSRVYVVLLLGCNFFFQIDQIRRYVVRKRQIRLLLDRRTTTAGPSYLCGFAKQDVCIYGNMVVRAHGGGECERAHVFAWGRPRRLWKIPPHTPAVPRGRRPAGLLDRIEHVWLSYVADQQLHSVPCRSAEKREILLCVDNGSSNVH